MAEFDKTHLWLYPKQESSIDCPQSEPGHRLALPRFSTCKAARHQMDAVPGQPRRASRSTMALGAESSSVRSQNGHCSDAPSSAPPNQATPVASGCLRPKKKQKPKAHVHWEFLRAPLESSNRLKAPEPETIPWRWSRTLLWWVICGKPRLIVPWQCFDIGPRQFPAGRCCKPALQPLNMPQVIEN